MIDSVFAVVSNIDQLLRTVTHFPIKNSNFKYHNESLRGYSLPTVLSYDNSLQENSLLENFYLKNDMFAGLDLG